LIDIEDWRAIGQAAILVALLIILIVVLAAVGGVAVAIFEEARSM